MIRILLTFFVILMSTKSSRAGTDTSNRERVAKHKLLLTAESATGFANQMAKSKASL